MPRILLIDDDSAVRSVFQEFLLDAGYEIDVIGTKVGGCELLGGRSYDLVIADGLLPDGTGMAVADKARERGIGTLIVTGYGCALTSETFDRYKILQKPVRRADLIEAVRQALDI
jgi:DNA-binding NtrC family response regulator